MAVAAPLNVDLHCHSSFSDGVLAPEALAQRAHKQGVQVWSLTDHDELGGLAQAAKAAADQGLVFIPGVEISVSWARQTVHIVGLNIDPEHAGLVNALNELRSWRESRARDMGDKLATLGFDGCYEGALTYADNPQLLSRTHFARYMVSRGWFKTMQDVFDRYLGDGKPGNVPTRWASLEDAVNWIRAAGGMAVIAHPGRYKFDDTQFDALYEVFRDAGGQGIEVVTGSHRPDQYATYAQIAKHYGFKASRGSDFHSPDESPADLGALPPLPQGLKPVWADWV
ncbi:3',5'-nucleoside bisphosphate phosphatase [Pusillimonas minor]|uniref:PHP domain-containing protein n=1 Tax=Pusillimonas minor TaxID=2697024 RepID=A0A842HNW4_9BURK|nr:3',5'-nucleoside bisphosphate phosphatase [Pusillimonas minor]MBC2769584.1 PHP domain-containing protein [Pusillimonas minor]